MIFVDVGTDRFEELVMAIDEIAPQIDEEIVIKIGKGHYKPKNCKYYSFVPEIEPFYENARFLITHGGAGTTFKLLGRGKKIIGVANFHKPDNHQEQILKVLSEKGYLLWCKDMKNLLELIKRIDSIEFKEYVPPECKINEVIVEKIEEWFSKKS